MINTNKITKSVKITYVVSRPEVRKGRSTSRVRKTLEELEVVAEVGEAIRRHEFTQLFNL